MPRFGISASLATAYGVQAVILAAIAGAAVAVALALRADIHTLNDMRVPRIVEASRLARQAEAVTAYIPTLVFARDSGSADTAATVLRDRLDTLGGLIDGLAGPDGAGLDRLTALRRRLGERVDRLTRLVRRRLARRRRLAAIGRALPAPDDAPAAGAARARALVARALTARDRDRLDRLRDRFKTALAGLSPPQRRALAPLGTGADGAFRVRADLLATRRALRGTHRNMEATALRLTGTAWAFLHTVQDRVEKQAGAAGRLAVVAAWGLGGAAVAAVTATLGLMLFLRRRVFRRLRTLTRNVRATAAGRDAPLRLGGNDELADLARGLDIFVRRLRRREKALARARNAAEDALADARRARAALVQAEKMAALGHLVAGMAHELGTPVGTALSAGSHMRDQVQALEAAFAEGRLTRRQLQDGLATLRESGDLLVRNTERAARLVDSFKEVAADQGHERPRRLDLATYLGECLAALGPGLPRTDHDVRLDASPGLEATLYPDVLFRVVTELVRNATQHAWPAGAAGTVTVTAGPDPDRPDTHVRLAVGDDGAGLPEGAGERVLEPFFTTRRADGHPGLGLSTVHNLVTGPLNGTVAVGATEAGGACFVIRFPAHAPAAEATTPDHGEAT